MKRKANGGRKARKPTSRNTLAAMIAAEPDQKKPELAWNGTTATEQNDPINRLAIEFFEIRKLDLKSPATGELAMLAFRTAAQQANNFAVEALMNWEPEAFEKLALAMRRTKRGEFEPLWSRTEHERFMWMDLILEQRNETPNIYRLARRFCEIHFSGLNNDDKARKVASIERKFRELRKRFFPLTPKHG